jgi:uncharacterized protein (DUF2147 family)
MKPRQIMNNLMKTSVALALTLFASTSVWADTSPVGVWRTIDDVTNEIKAEIQIVEKDGVLTGTILRSFKKGTNETTLCLECKDDRKNKPIFGLEILRDVRKEAGELLWAGGGKILDPENGKEYSVRMVPQDEGKKLRVRGYIGPFYRTQVWERIQ